MLRMKTPGSPESSVMRMRSPRIAPPENGLEGSIATMPTVRPVDRNCWASARTMVDLPLPGTPVIPMVWARPANRWISATRLRLPGAVDSAIAMARATAFRLPSRTAAMSASCPPGMGACAGDDATDGSDMSGRARFLAQVPIGICQPYVMGPCGGELLPFLPAKIANVPRRRARPELVPFDALAGRQKGAGRDHRTLFDDAAVHNGCAHADQAAVLEGTGVNQGHVADGDIGTDVGPERFAGDMDDSPVLDIGA